MRIVFTFLLLCLFTQVNVGLAQIGIGSIEQMAPKPGEIDPADLELLKKTTTIFAYRPSDKDRVDALEKIFQEVWTITKYKLIPYNELDEYLQDVGNYSYLTMAGFSTTVRMTTISYDNSHFYLNLWLNKLNKKYKNERVSFCRIELYPSFETYTESGDKSEDVLDYLYTKSNFYNWQPGFLKAYLKVVNDYLLQNKERSIFMYTEHAADLLQLKTDTLYIPDYTLVKFNMFTGNEDKRHAIEELVKDYPYAYKVIPAAELSDLILSSEKPIYYLVYLKSSTDKYFSVYNSKTGALIYNEYTAVSYNIKDKDFDALAKRIKKLSK